MNHVESRLIFRTKVVELGRLGQRLAVGALPAGRVLHVEKDLVDDPGDGREPLHGPQGEAVVAAADVDVQAGRLVDVDAQLAHPAAEAADLDERLALVGVHDLGGDLLADPVVAAVLLVLGLADGAVPDDAPGIVLGDVVVGRHELVASLVADGDALELSQVSDEKIVRSLGLENIVPVVGLENWTEVRVSIRLVTKQDGLEELQLDSEGQMTLRVIVGDDYVVEVGHRDVGVGGGMVSVVC